MEVPMTFFPPSRLLSLCEKSKRYGSHNHQGCVLNRITQSNVCGYIDINGFHTICPAWEDKVLSSASAYQVSLGSRASSHDFPRRPWKTEDRFEKCCGMQINVCVNVSLSRKSHIAFVYRRKLGISRAILV